ERDGGARHPVGLGKGINSTNSAAGVVSAPGTEHECTANNTLIGGDGQLLLSVRSRNIILRETVMGRAQHSTHEGEMSASFRLPAGQLFHPCPPVPDHRSPLCKCRHYYRTRRKTADDRGLRTWAPPLTDHFVVWLKERYLPAN
ncbi:mCG145894, partial [Mus musculus]